MPRDGSELARRLACDAEAVCRCYLSNGHHQGRYWMVGDVHNTPGRSMFVRLVGPESGPGAAGRWTDAATGEHGDLLDVIRESCGFVDFRDVAEEARRFLGLRCAGPRRNPEPVHTPVRAGSSRAAQRLLAMSRPIRRTLVETYLYNRGIKTAHDAGALRFHPRCYYRPDAYSATETWPAMIAAVTDLDGKITGAHRTYLDPSGLNPCGFSEVRLGKAPIEAPRRAMGNLLGNAVRFGAASDVMAAGEGIETMLSLRCILPAMPVVAALSAAHLTALELPVTLRRLYIVRDNDPAGEGASERLGARAEAKGIEALTIVPTLGDLNDDLRLRGPDALRASLRDQLIPKDACRFLGPQQMA